MGIRAWLQRQLGINDLYSRTLYLEKLEQFTLADVVERLSESMIVLTGEGQVLRNVDVVVGENNKTGVLVLGNNTRIEGGYFRPPKTRTIVEMVDDENKYSEL